MHPWLLFALVSLFVLAFVYPFYAGKKLPRHPVIRAAVKGLGAAAAAGLACYGAMRLPQAASWLITAGLGTCVSADIMLLVSPLAGTGLFLVGHLLYLSAFLRLAPFQPTSIAIFLLLYLFVIVLFYPEREERKIIPYLLYGAVLLSMLSVSLLLPPLLGARGFAAAAGASLFTASDSLIAWSVLKKPLRNQSYLVMGLYYCAQLLLSLVALQPWL